MLCPYCGISLMSVDQYRLYCAVCAATFTKALICPECRADILQITDANKMLCSSAKCPSRNPRHFNLPVNLSHLKEFFVPYVLPPPEPKTELKLDRAAIGPFTCIKFWRGESEFEIVVEFSKPFKHSSELAWDWNEEARTLSIRGAKDATKELAGRIVLEELKNKIIREVSHKKKTVSKLLVITFLLS